MIIAEHPAFHERPVRRIVLNDGTLLAFDYAERGPIDELARTWIVADLTCAVGNCLGGELHFAIRHDKQEQCSARPDRGKQLFDYEL
jgi:hypothetical protein